MAPQATYSRAVDRSASHSTRDRAPDITRTGGEPAVRDASEVLARVAEDEAAADAARERYRNQPMTAIRPDPRVAARLAPGEVVFATRMPAILDRREPRPDTGAPTGLAGELYVTSRRLILLGRVRLSIDLDAIDEAVMSGERLLLALRDGRGVAIAAARPRLLRVEIAAARAAVRA